ncbi:PREDICTED: aldehyde dehydrogenase family 3 member F1-like [Tarenaya hassleriana]|uniref:aldehyde dehydrogenase family 3 member F1-like n=1 Tax=Tarenaya hassleriana TaxID=28532 RepID=UPI00053C4644|nr:PREDICTED: aldehyde dehydrogenase family 3 member F1-like [Tarenaya hassleriana]
MYRRRHTHVKVEEKKISLEPGKMESMGNLETEVEEAKEYYKTGKTRDFSWRKTQLKGIQNLLRDQESEFFEALRQDLGKHHVEAFRDEIGTTMKSANYALANLKHWMSNKKAELPIIALLSSAEVSPEPLGLVLVMSSWNIPIGLCLEPLIGALAAGNAVVLKPSELSPSCSSLLAKTIPKYLDGKAVKVVEGGPDVGERLLQRKWDKIFFTGSARVGRIVLSAAAEHLTPVTLELGGKCPAIIDSLTRSWDQQVAANRMIGAKFGSCAGQACIAVDYALVEKAYAPTLIELMKRGVEKMFGENPRKSNSIGRIGHMNNFLRLKSLLEDERIKECIVHGGSVDAENMFIEPTILLDPPLDSKVMTEEIFGPVLPIITLKKIEDSIEFISSRSKPLAIYAFTNDEKFKKRLLSETSSGSLIFNDAIIQYAADTLPFGGVGESGIGKYHGKYSFEAFSHYKAVAYRSFLTDFWFRFPPWNDNKLELFRTAYNYDYVGMLLVILGLKRSTKTHLQ